MWKAAAATWHLQVASTALWFSIGSVQAFFGQVPSSDGTADGKQSLGQFCVYINLFGAFIGKVLAIFRGLKILRTPKRLMIACLLLLPFSLLYALYITQLLGFLNDIAFLIFVALFRVVTGYFSAIMYTMLDCDEDLKTQAVSFLNVTTFVGILTALSYSFGLSAGANF